MTSVGDIFPANDVIMRSNVTHILRFYEFANLAEKFLFMPFWAVFGDLLS